MSDPYLDGEQVVIPRLSCQKKGAQILLRTEVVPGIFLQTTCHGHVTKNKRTGKWVFKGREFNTPEGACIASFMHDEEHPRYKDPIL